MGVLHEMADEHDASYREYEAALKADRRYEPARQNLLWLRRPVTAPATATRANVDICRMLT